MLRRSLLELSTRRLSHIRRLPRQIAAQNPSLYVSSVRGFSTTPQQNVNGRSRRGASKVLIGSVAIGAAAMMAYSAGYLDPYLGKGPQVAVPSVDDASVKKLQELMKESEAPADSLSAGEQRISSGVEYAEKPIDSLTEPTPSEDAMKTDVESQTHVESIHGESNVTLQGEEGLPKSSDGDLTVEAMNAKFDSSERGSVGTETLEDNTKEEQLKGTENASIFSHASTLSQDNTTKAQETHPTSEDRSKDIQSHVGDPPHSLIDEYNLNNGAGRKTAEIPESGNSEEEEAPNEISKDFDDIHESKDGKFILDFLQAIHTAEQRQAELDARIHSEEKRTMKEKYDKELKDARARELMYAEEVAMLEKEIKKEKAKAAAALKSLQESAEERLKSELEQKEKEAESEVKEVQEFAKAELAAAIAREKAAMIEDMAEANLHINALCMAFYARSKEARQTHSVHKLALGALALEDALSKGRSIQPEVDAIRTCLDVVDNDSLVDLVLSSLPEEIESCGTDTPLQLNQKFDELKGSLRHFSLIPPGGGGILAHSLAYIASFLKVREANKSGNGIESVINRVQSLLAEGKLAEAADVLESGVQGSEALSVVGEWVRQARNRAITEQALMLLQSYTTCMSFT